MAAVHHVPVLALAQAVAVQALAELQVAEVAQVAADVQAEVAQAVREDDALQSDGESVVATAKNFSR